MNGRDRERSDFEIRILNFSRQHHTRIREQNNTHTIVSFLDNAIRADQQPAITEWSRDLLLILREDIMRAEMIASYDHPHREHNYRRGSYQALPNVNVIMGAYFFYVHRTLSDWRTDFIVVIAKNRQAGRNLDCNPNVLRNGKLIMEAELVERKLSIAMLIFITGRRRVLIIVDYCLGIYRRVQVPVCCHFRLSPQCLFECFEHGSRDHYFCLCELE